MLLNAARFASAGPSWLPSDIATLVGWWDPDDSDSLTLSGADIRIVDNLAEVSTDGDMVWYGEMGSALQGTRAVPFQTGNTINGRDCLGIRGDAAAAGMGNRANAMTWAGNKVGTGDFLAAMVVQHAAAGTTLSYLLHNGLGDAGGGAFRIVWNYPAAGGLQIDAYGTNWSEGAILALTGAQHPLGDGDPHWVGLWRVGATLSAIIDGVVVGTLGTPPTTALHNTGSVNAGNGRLFLGCSVNLPDSLQASWATRHFNIGETLLCKGTVSAGEVASLDAYLAARWGT